MDTSPEADRAVIHSLYTRRFYEAIGAAIYVRSHIEQEFPTPSSSVAAVLSAEELAARTAELEALISRTLDVVPAPEF